MFQDEVLSAEQRDHLHEGYRVMAEAVSESLRSYLWVVGHVHRTYLARRKDTHVVPALLLMEYAEPIDGVSILARTGSAKGCVPLIRSAFELQLNLLYMLERDDTYENRCLAYEFFHWMKQMKVAEKCDPASVAGKQVRGQIKGELLADAFDHPKRDIAAESAAIQKMVDNSRYRAVKAEYDLSKPKHWYAMWGGPRDLERLAHALKRHGHYEVMYRYWSGAAHGESALKRLLEGGEKMEMDMVRSPKGLPMACLHAGSLANEMAAFLVGRFLPALRDDLASRYRSRVKPGLDYIKSIRGLEG
jgi:hypothetical protein